jgi:hypothetical protein
MDRFRNEGLRRLLLFASLAWSSSESSTLLVAEQSPSNGMYWEPGQRRLSKSVLNPPALHQRHTPTPCGLVRKAASIFDRPAQSVPNRHRRLGRFLVFSCENGAS